MTARVPALALLLAVALVASAAATAVDNPADPPGKRQVLAPTEAWRVGGEDDEVFFGSVQRVLTGPEGRVLILDNQLNQVQVYGPDGQWQRSLGREGDGPGEVRGAADAWYLPDGRLCLAQSFPGRLVYLNPDGTPGGQAQYQPLGDPVTFVVAVAGRSVPAGMLLTGIRFNQSGGPEAQQTFFLSTCDPSGEEQTVFLEKQYAINYADFRLDEAAMDFVYMNRFDADTDGTVYFAPDRDLYRIEVHGPAGELLREFGRPVNAPPRSEQEKAIAVKVHEAIGANYGVPLRGVTVEDREAVIQNLWVRPGGELWVRTPANARPEGAFTLLDVFDAQGHFQHQVELRLPGDPDRDGLFLLDDGRFAVVVGGLDAWLSQQGVESSSEDAPVLEVICYEAK